MGEVAVAKPDQESGGGGTGSLKEPRRGGKCQQGLLPAHGES